ncbi:MAG: TRAP transporter TatT component family protein [Spirochaetia bacterium]|nr:TRAP transporter TatT component family protein [Spirochaetia bacterium]
MNKLVVSGVSGAMDKGRSAFEREPDLDIAETALASNLKLLEAVLQQDPENIQLRLFLAEGYALYSMAFVEDRYEELDYSDSELADYQRKRAILFYNRSKNYASDDLLKKMNTSSVDLVNEDTLKKYLAQTKKEDVRALFWFAFSWGAAINLQRDEIVQLASLPYIEMIMNRVKELDDKYYFGGVYLFEGMYYGGRPPMLGGDMERSKAAFEKALAISDKKILLVSYYYARSYCIQIQDLECFKKNLDFVINSKDDIYPEQMLANSLAKRKAIRLLKHGSGYFIEDEK